ncbi:MAG: TRAP transporter small permease subunit [Rhodoplanes sp.]
MLLIIVQVIQRYVIGLGSIQMEEAQWHLFAIGFMLGLSLAAVRERHVRIPDGRGRRAENAVC